jgi:hypothetical protein
MSVDMRAVRAGLKVLGDEEGACNDVAKGLNRLLGNGNSQRTEEEALAYQEETLRQFEDQTAEVLRLLGWVRATCELPDQPPIGPPAPVKAAVADVDTVRLPRTEVAVVRAPAAGTAVAVAPTAAPPVVPRPMTVQPDGTGRVNVDGVIIKLSEEEVARRKLVELTLEERIEEDAKVILRRAKEAADRTVELERGETEKAWAIWGEQERPVSWFVRLKERIGVWTATTLEKLR